MISADDICLCTCLELNEWDLRSKRKTALFWLVLNYVAKHTHEKHCVCIDFMNVNIALHSHTYEKAKFSTRVHKKDVSFIAL